MELHVCKYLKELCEDCSLDNTLNPMHLIFLNPHFHILTYDSERRKAPCNAINDVHKNGYLNLQK